MTEEETKKFNPILGNLADMARKTTPLPSYKPDSKFLNKDNGNGTKTKAQKEEEIKLNEFNKNLEEELKKIEQENKEREEFKKARIKEEQEKTEKEAEEALDGESGFDADKKLIEVDWEKLKKESEEQDD